MPPRLSHRKSRGGCRRCKERKVKCDEARPSCSACLRHGIACEYPESSTQVVERLLPDTTTTSSHSSQKAATPTPEAVTNFSNSHSVQGSAASPLNNGPDTPYSDIVASLILPDSRRHAIELFLLHRFTSTVATTFPSAREERMKHMYTWQAPNLACDNRFLLDAIFAITALHICKTVNSQRTGYTEVSELPELVRGIDFARLHRIYLNQAVHQQREAVATLGPSNSDAVGLTSILLSIMATCLLPDSDSMAVGTYRPPVQWLRMSNSINTVFHMSFPHVREGSIMMNYFQAGREPDFSDSEMLFNPENARPFRQILEYRKSANFLSDHSARQNYVENDPLARETYRMALAYIGSIHRAILENEPAHQLCQRVVTFGPLCPTQFIQLVDDARPRALVILAHWMAMAKHIDDDFWWFKGRAEREVFGIQSILPQDWQWALAWPLAVLESPLKARLDPEPFNASPNA